MQDLTYISICLYLAAVNILAVVLTVRDKCAARKKSWRVKEKTLIIVSCLGGSVVMLVTMLGIRHKTKHIKFMAGIPVIIITQIVVVLLVWYVLGNGVPLLR